MVKRIWEALQGFIKGGTPDKAATLAMRFARPVFWVLITVMLVVGWFQPENLGTYLAALAKAPDWFADIITIMALGLSVEKGARSVGDAVANVKKATS